MQIIKNIIILFALIIILTIALKTEINTSKVIIEHGKLVISINKQNDFTTLSGIYIKRDGDEQNFYWHYESSDDAMPKNIELPRKIIIGLDPFKSKTSINSNVMAMKSGNYTATIVIDTWGNDYSSKKIAQTININFCIKSNLGSKTYQLC